MSTLQPTEPIEKKLKNFRWYQNKAIDFSKRNRLLKYPKKGVSVEFDITFEECASFFGSPGELNITLPHKSILEQEETQEEPQLFSGMDTEKNETIISLPKTNVKGKKLIAQLDKLRLQAKKNFDSHGLHTLFLAVGEISWKEQLAGRGSSEAVKENDYFAPLLLIPVQVENRKTPEKKTVIELNDELYDIKINPVLLLLMKQELELRLPELPDDLSLISWEEIYNFLNEFKKIFSEKGIVCDTSTKIRLGQYTFNGQQIYEDLIQNEKQFLEKEFISSLCGDGQIIQTNSDDVTLENEEDIDELLTEEEDFNIRDADESQLLSIKRIIDGKHMIVHGPPGTGKSQTIANLISNLIARGKKVLFVCEKQVALDVVYNRLKTEGGDVSDLCLPLFQYTTDKKLFAKSIIDSRERILSALRGVSKSNISQKLEDRENVIKSLKSYSEALLSKVEPLNKEIYWIHGELARVSPHIEDHVFPWKGDTLEKIDFQTYKKIGVILENLNSCVDLGFDKDNHWKNLRRESFSPDYGARLFSNLNNYKKIVDNFPVLVGTIFGNPSGIAEVKEILAFSESHDVSSLLKQQCIITDDFSSQNLKNEIEILEKIQADISIYRDILGDNKNFTIPTDWEEHDFLIHFLSDDLSLKELVDGRTSFSIIKNKIKVLRSFVSENKHASEISILNGETLKKYKGLFNTDPIILKLKKWDERVFLYEMINELKQVKNIYDQLLNSQNTLNEWAVSVEELSHSNIWEIEQRFSTKYKPFFRSIYSNYKSDKITIANWCAAHRPQTFDDYRKIVFAVSDKLRLQKKYDKMIGDFVDKYAVDDSIKQISVYSLIDSIDKVTTYLESVNVDRLSGDIKNLFISTECFESYKQIIFVFEEILDKAQLFNSFTVSELLSDALPLDEVLKNTEIIIDEIDYLLGHFSDVNQYVTYQKTLPVVSELGKDISTLNHLKDAYKELVADNFSHHTGINDINELLKSSSKIEQQKQQINAVLAIIGEKTFLQADFYRNLERLNSEINIWKLWYAQYLEIKEMVGLLMENKEAMDELEKLNMLELSKYISIMTSDNAGLERWINYQRLKSQLNEYGMQWFIDSAISIGNRDFNLSDLFVWSFLNKVLENTYEKNSVLKNFNIADYNRYLNQFRQLEKDVFSVNQYRVLMKMYPFIKFGMDRGGTSERTLVRESQKVKRHLPIRKLVQENATHLLEFKPCWMMSPLTLSSYVPFGSVEFDVVIFDEASQMKIENALGAIARSKQVVVIGDENQLPPTSFFDSSSDDEEDEEEMEEVGYESILQSSIAILPGAQTELLYHYRSTYEDLIAFSNKHIYENRLITFPNPNYKAGSVIFEYVEGAVYDAGKTRRNRIEAVRVAELCFKHFEDSVSSLGVIAFSKAQEEAIREAIEEKMKEYPQFTEKFDETSEKKNAFFIKNLESVQGDERDVIILSVGYGPDQNGHIFNRFGPLNSKGGYRRLNVAVTRAKDKIICVSSMKFYELNPPESSRGAVLLQKYLEYAEKGREVLTASKILQPGDRDLDSSFELSVKEALEKIGYTVHPQVGASGFSIDLAIVNPKNENEYLLGIECDGASYHSSKSARMNDRFRQGVLENLGWKIYRIWSQHWITHRDEILDDIIKMVNLNQ